MFPPCAAFARAETITGPARMIYNVRAHGGAHGRQHNTIASKSPSKQFNAHARGQTMVIQPATGASAESSSGWRHLGRRTPAGKHRKTPTVSIALGQGPSDKDACAF